MVSPEEKKVSKNHRPKPSILVQLLTTVIGIAGGMVVVYLVTGGSRGLLGQLLGRLW